MSWEGADLGQNQGCLTHSTTTSEFSLGWCLCPLSLFPKSSEVLC